MYCNKLITFLLLLFVGGYATAQNAIIKEGGVRLNGTASGQVARWNGSNWLAAEPTVTSAAPLTGNGTAATPLTLANGTSAGDVLTWTGSAWASSPISVNVDPSLDGDGSVGSPLMIAGAGSATPGQFLIASGSGGVLWDDLSIGNTLTGDGVTTNLNLAQQGATSGQVLKWNGTTWAPATDAGTTYTAGTGIDVTGTVISNTGDLSDSNEGALTVGAGTASTSIINSNTTGSTGVTLSAGANVAITESGNTITIAASSGPGTDLSVSGTSSPLTINSSSGADLTLTAGSNITLAGTSSSITITATEVDGLTDNEGVLGVGAGTGTTSVITTNTTGGTGVTFSFDNNLSVTETTGSNGGTITVVGPRVREEVFSATSNQTNFTLTGPAYDAPSGTVQQLLVYRNGVLLKYAASAPTITQFTYSSNVVTTAACALGDDIVIRYIQP